MIFFENEFKISQDCKHNGFFGFLLHVCVFHNAYFTMSNFSTIHIEIRRNHESKSFIGGNQIQNYFIEVTHFNDFRANSSSLQLQRKLNI